MTKKQFKTPKRSSHSRMFAEDSWTQGFATDISNSEYRRPFQVAEIVRKHLCDILIKTSFRDPILENSNLITVSEVRMTADLKSARVMVYPLNLSINAKNLSAYQTENNPSPDSNYGKIHEIIDALNRASGFIRNILAKNMTQKFTPALIFYCDSRFDEASHVEKILRDSDNV